MTFHFVVYLVGQFQSAVIHCQQETFNFQFRVELALDYFYCVQQFADSFQGEIFALYRDYDRVCRSKGVDSDESKRRGTVYQNEIVVVFNRGQQFFYHLLSMLYVEHFYFSANQVDVARDDVKSVDVCCVYGVTHVCSVDYAFV